MKESAGARRISMRSPSTIRKASSATHAMTPRIPVVTNDAGMKPMPDEKSMFQKTVEFRDASRYLSHCAPKVPGPEPKTGAVAYVFCAIEIVDSHEGRTETTFTWSLLARA